MGKVGEFQTPSGRWLLLRELRQYETYEGLLVGSPTTRMNERLLKDLVEERRGKDYPIGPVQLIQPAAKLLDYQRDARDPYGYETPAALPAIVCIGRFASFQPARNAKRNGSGLIVIWFQEEFAFPIDPEVVWKILALDWESLAQDFDY